MRPEENIFAPNMASYETTAVLFLDVLGTKNRKTFDAKFSVHRLFHTELQHNAARQGQLPHVIYKRDLRSFSDCVYILYQYKEAIEESRKDNTHCLNISRTPFNGFWKKLRTVIQNFV